MCAGRKRRIDAARIREAMTEAGTPAPMEGGKLRYIGPDSCGVELEVVVVPDDKTPGDLAAIHAMPTHHHTKGATS